jgi:hypothetical protein
MKFKEILGRITGLSCSVFGLSWNPPEPARTVARRIIAFLEDRRVLFAPSEMEVPDHCVQSVLVIRDFLSMEIGKLDSGNEIAEAMRGMRAACRKFLDTVSGGRGADLLKYGGHSGHWASWVFNSSLGEMRGVFGIQVAKLAAAYGLDVEDELAAILPGRDEDDGFTLGTEPETPTPAVRRKKKG